MGATYKPEFEKKKKTKEKENTFSRNNQTQNPQLLEIRESTNSSAGFSFLFFFTRRSKNSDEQHESLALYTNRSRRQIGHNNMPTGGHTYVLMQAQRPNDEKKQISGK